MEVELIVVPYDSGQRNARMGAGPLRLAEGGLPEALRESRATVHLREITARESFRGETSTAFELNRQIADQVRHARERGRFPLICAGNCHSAVGVLAGLGSARAGAIWFDAHGDFNTPEATESGILDGMALAIVAGSCWQKLAASVPGFQPLPGAQIVHIGGRDFSDGEEARMQAAGLHRLPPAPLDQLGAGSAFERTIDALQSRVREVYLHLDVDVIDHGEACANEFAAPGGLTIRQVVQMVAQIQRRFVITAASITAYDPSFDRDDATLQAALDLARAVVADAAELCAEQPTAE